MSSIVTAVFRATIGLLMNKGRDKAAEKLKEGDVTDQKFRGLIVREIDDIKSKLDGLSRKDLLASISFFEEGIELLYDVFDKARSRSDGGEVPVEAACAEAFAIAEEMKNVQLTGLDESAARALVNAKKRFKEARREATRAFKNEALKTSDRILAMEYRVMATILETVDSPADSMAPCRACIKELNCLSAVQNSFDVQLRKGIMAVKALFGKDERRKIISSVCQVNRVVFDVTQAVGKDEPFWTRPAVDTKDEKLDPLCDGRIFEVLRKQDMEHCFLAPWSFGQVGKEEHKLGDPHGIAINSKGQFIVGDNEDGTVKVYDATGKFIHHFNLPDDAYRRLELHKGAPCFVFKFNNTGELFYKFSLKDKGAFHETLPRGLTVDSMGKVLCLYNSNVDVYGEYGQFAHSFGKELSGVTHDITCASDGRIMVLDADSVHVFNEHGDHLAEIKHKQIYGYKSKIAVHNSSGHVVIAHTREVGCLNVEIYTIDGEYVRSIEIHTEIQSFFPLGLAVSADGRIALVTQGLVSCEGKLFIVG